MPKIQLTAPMPNGATSGDWLGTATTAARLAADAIERVRSGHAFDEGMLLRRARLQLQQALEETEAVMTRHAIPREEVT